MSLIRIDIQVIDKNLPGHSRAKVFKEIELLKMCTANPNILQLIEYFEDGTRFYLVFEKMYGGDYRYRFWPEVSNCFASSDVECRRLLANILWYSLDCEAARG